MIMDGSEPETAATSSFKRVFPPLYTPTGDASTDRLAFFHILEKLKVSTYPYIYPVTVCLMHALIVIRPRSARDGSITRNISFLYLHVSHS
jgi:hypothetical protein